MSSERTRALLALVFVVYIVLGTLFAVYTPAWQAPDEPAHYNYIRGLVERGDLPVLQMGDYPHAYLEELKSRRFPPDLSIDPVRYESHQPPFYYLLAAPVFALAGGALLPLRLLSVLLGSGIVLCAWAIGLRIFPGRAAVAAGAAAFVALLPQHLATVSQVGNDALAELLLALVLYLLVKWTMGGRKQPTESTPDGSRTFGPARIPISELLILGLLLGFILITKTTAYIAVPLTGDVLIWRWWHEKASARRIAADLILVAGLALLIALPWFARNVAVYGWPDLLGLRRHDAIVVGQLRTGEYLAQYGWGSYLRRLAEFTFKSFWGVFGWLGVFMDSRVYWVTALLGVVALTGLGLRLARPPRDDDRDAPRSRHMRVTIWLLLANVALTLLAYAWYNLAFVQHQGRYLFTALIPIALGFAVGWEAALCRGNSRFVALILLVLGFGLAAWGLSGSSGLPKWPIAITWVLAAGLAIRPYLPRRLDPLASAAPYLALILLDVYALFGAILPQLRS